jgi:hypothetical protein
LEITLTIPEVLETLASLHLPQEVLALRPSAAMQEHIEGLLEKNRNGGLSDDEQRAWAQYQSIEHQVRMAKALAALKLKLG